MSIIQALPLTQIEECRAFSGDPPSLVAPIRGFGRGALRTNPTGASVSAVQICRQSSVGMTTNLALPAAYGIFHVKIDVAPTVNHEVLARFMWGTNRKLQLGINSSRNLVAMDRSNVIQAVSTTVLELGVVYRIMMYSVNGEPGPYAVWIAAENDPFGDPEMSGTCNQQAGNCDRFEIGKYSNLNSNSVDYTFQDLLICDTQFNDPYKIGVGVPIANGPLTDWVGDYTDIDEYPHNGDTDFISASLAGTDSTFQMTSFANLAGDSNGTIHGVAVWGVKRKDSASAANQFSTIQSGATLAVSGLNSGADTYVGTNTVWELDPNGDIPWTPASYDAAFYGNRLGTSQPSRCTQLNTFVIYTADSPTPPPEAFDTADWAVADATTGARFLLLIDALPASTEPITDIEYRLDGGSAVSTGLTAPDIVVIAGLTNGQAYNVEVRAVSANGAGPWSSVKSATPTIGGGGGGIGGIARLIGNGLLG